MDDALTSASTDWARLAALREANAPLWLTRFTRLFESQLLSLPVQPGYEICVRPGPLAAGLNYRQTREFCRREVVALLGAGYAVGLDIEQVRRGDVANWLRCLTECLAADLAPGNAGVQRLLVSLTDRHPALRQILGLRQEARPGLSRLAIRFSAPAQHTDVAVWQHLLAASHADSSILLLPGFAVRPLSGLHSAERGQVVLPESLFEVPANTAWMMLDVDARSLRDPAEIRAQLSRCLRFADNLIDTVDWSYPALKLDALLNRRVAIHISHIGDRLAAERVDPSGPDAHTRLRRWLQFVRRCFVHESNLLARHRGPFPQLCTEELVATLTPRYGVADAHRLVRNRILRHRHLLALSPLSVVPEDDHSIAAHHWIDLIPALGCADIITMRGSDVRTRLDLQGWSRLLTLTGGIAANYVISAGGKRY